MSLQNKWMSGIKSGGEEIMDRWFSPFTQNVRKVWNSRMDRILDVGCGEGTHVGHLLSRMRRGVVTGIDDNPSCVLKAIENNKRRSWMDDAALSWEVWKNFRLPVIPLIW